MALRGRGWVPPGGGARRQNEEYSKNDDAVFCRRVNLERPCAFGRVRPTVILNSPRNLAREFIMPGKSACQFAPRENCSPTVQLSSCFKSARPDASACSALTGRSAE